MTEANRMTLDDLAHQAVTDPSTLGPADITRLGDFILDHQEHIAFHRRVAGIVSFGNGGALTKRLAPQAPEPPALPTETAED